MIIERERLDKEREKNEAKLRRGFNAEEEEELQLKLKSKGIPTDMVQINFDSIDNEKLIQRYIQITKVWVKSLINKHLYEIANDQSINLNFINISGLNKGHKAVERFYQTALRTKILL